MPITATFRHRDSMSEAKASMRKFRDVTSSSRGLFSWLKKNSPAISAAASRRPRVIIYTARRFFMERRII